MSFGLAATGDIDEYAEEENILQENDDDGFFNFGPMAVSAKFNGQNEEQEEEEEEESKEDSEKIIRAMISDEER